MLGPHLSYPLSLPSYHCNLWPPPTGQPSPYVLCILCLFSLLGGWEGGFSLNRGFTYVFLDVHIHHVLDIGYSINTDWYHLTGCVSL